MGLSNRFSPQTRWKCSGLCRLYSNHLSSCDKMLHPLPHPDELFADLAQARFFSKLDFSRCYEQYELEEKSKEFLVINTQLGLYRYNVLPYGLASAPAIVQAAQERLLSGIRGVKIYIDDVLIFSRSKEEHFRILNEVFSRISNAGGRLKPGKCILMGEELTYLGFHIPKWPIPGSRVDSTGSGLSCSCIVY
nr:uncharacterized protein K02A2.6-like [Lepeophtheirus salmonis]